MTDDGGGGDGGGVVGGKGSIAHHLDRISCGQEAYAGAVVCLPADKDVVEGKLVMMEAVRSVSHNL